MNRADLKTIKSISNLLIIGGIFFVLIGAVLWDKSGHSVGMGLITVANGLFLRNDYFSKSGSTPNQMLKNVGIGALFLGFIALAIKVSGL